jgi:hypothetical protein
VFSSFFNLTNGMPVNDEINDVSSRSDCKQDGAVWYTPFTIKLGHVLLMKLISQSNAMLLLRRVMTWITIQFAFRVFDSSDTNDCTESEKKAVGGGRVTMKVQTLWHRNVWRRQGYCDNRGSGRKHSALAWR